MTATSFLSRHPCPAAVRFAMRSALAAAMLIAGEGQALAREPSPQAAIQAQLARGNAGKAVALGEAAVAAAPQDAALRGALGRAYLRAGRFEAAASALHDEWALGGSSGQTILGLALAQIACGQNRAALATLDRGASTIAPAELGLALALAGDAEHGIAVLTDSVRAGEPDTAHHGLSGARLRQNLAYAYALDGRWDDARLTAGFDLPLDQVDARMQQWAQSMQSGGERLRIAGLLKVPVITDSGMPAALALNGAGTIGAPGPDVAKSTIDPTAKLPAAPSAPATAVTEPVPAPAAPLANFSPAAARQPPPHRAAGPVHHAASISTASSSLAPFPARLRQSAPS